MKVSELAEKFGLRIFSDLPCHDREITGGYVSDLLSDVMGNAGENEVWITLQTHQNIAAVASLKDLAAIILVKGLVPDDDTLKQCEKEGIPLLGTEMSTFETAGRLYSELNLNG